VNDLRCAEFVEQVTALLEGALDDENEHEMTEHVPVCPGCQRYLDQPDPPDDPRLAGTYRRHPGRSRPRIG
jgi:hypothetical protein